MVEAFNESTVEKAALSWFGELGYTVAHGPAIAPGEPEAERDSSLAMWFSLSGCERPLID